MTTPTYNEFADSQLPALKLLRKLGWTYISKEAAEKERNGILSNVILEGILESQLKKLNEFEYKGGTFKFSEGNIHSAIHSLKNIPDEGLLRTSERAYDLMTLGKSFEESVQGDKKSFTLKYIDWENIGNNVFHITEEFTVDGLNETRRPDLVLFVNGIPFVIIENKRRDKNFSIDECLSQFTRNQNKEIGIPKLFHFAQVLMAVHPNEVKYATIDTKPKFWAVWIEKIFTEKNVQELILSRANGVESEDRLPTEQDRILYSLCNIERLMELAYKFILYDAGEKKVTRYQQYFAVKNSLERIKELDSDGKRKGGVIWHTQGSGKSLTMVMLAKCISLEKDIKNPRVVIVTDRVDLDKQIYRTFHHCGKTPERAKSGNNLIELIENNSKEVITTVIDKFDAALNRKDFKNDSSNIFVLVDESHRSQYGTTHTRMKRILPNACYIGFTGTPLFSRDRTTVGKFGGFIDKYTIDQAVKDKAVLPLLYEGRSAKITQNKEQIDKGFQRVSEPLTEYQSAHLKKLFSSISEIYKSEQVVEEIAYDVSQHFTKNWQGTGFKAQLAVPFRATAMMYQKYFENQIDPKLKVNTAVVISSPDPREGYDDPEDDSNEEVQKFWKKISTRFGSAEQYEEAIIEKFKSADDAVEILIVVGKLLTGFDAPRNTILYIAKPLGGHNLLQAIARVNRLFEGKDFGYIIDYVGLLEELDLALTKYSVLNEFDEEDLIGALTNIKEEISKLSQRYSDLWDIFKEVPNKKDKEALERHLAPKDIRDNFYEKLTAFARNLQMAMAADEYVNMFSDKERNDFQKDLKFFQSLRHSVQTRYAEIVSYKEYESRIRKLLNTYISSDGIEQITEPLNIFDEEVFQREVEKISGSSASKADAIAYRMKKVIHEKMDHDPVFYQRFSELIEVTIDAFTQKRLDEIQYLATVNKIRTDFVSGTMEGTPGTLSSRPEARAFYNILKKTISENHKDVKIESINDRIAKSGIDLAELYRSMAIRDWRRNEDVQKQMKNSVEDYLLEKKSEMGLELSYEDIDKILDESLKVAKSNF